MAFSANDGETIWVDAKDLGLRNLNLEEVSQIWEQSDDSLFDRLTEQQKSFLMSIVWWESGSIPESVDVLTTFSSPKTIRTVHPPTARKIQAWPALMSWIKSFGTIADASRASGISHPTLRYWVKQESPVQFSASMARTIEDKIGIPTWAWVQEDDPQISYPEGPLKDFYHPLLDPDIAVGEDETKMILVDDPARALKIWRYQKGLDLPDAARLFELNSRTLGFTEAGNPSSPTAVIRIATWTGISPMSWTNINWGKIGIHGGSPKQNDFIPGKYIREWRARNGYTLEQAGLILGYSKGGLSNMERGIENISIESAIRIEAILGIPIQSWPNLKDYKKPREPVWKLWCWRSFKGISKDEAAARIGVSPRIYDHWERNESAPTLTDAQKIYDATGIFEFLNEREQFVPTGKSGAQYLKRNRMRRGLSQPQAAANIGTTESIWWKWENGRRIPSAVWRLTLSEEFMVPESSWFTSPYEEGAPGRDLWEWRISRFEDIDEFAAVIGMAPDVWLRLESGEQKPTPEQAQWLQNITKIPASKWFN